MLTYSNIIEHTVQHGGGTFNASLSGSADLPDTGYMVGAYNLGATTYTQASLNAITKQLDYARIFLSKLETGNNYIGTWLDDGLFYVDIAELVTDKAEAIQLCHERDELAYYDIALGESVTV